MPDPVPDHRPAPSRRRASRSDPRRRAASQVRTEEAITAFVARLVADAPPLSPQTRARLADLFSVTHSAVAKRRVQEARKPDKPAA